MTNRSPWQKCGVTQHQGLPGHQSGHTSLLYFMSSLKVEKPNILSNIKRKYFSNTARDLWVLEAGAVLLLLVATSHLPPGPLLSVSAHFHLLKYSPDEEAGTFLYKERMAESCAL